MRLLFVFSLPPFSLFMCICALGARSSASLIVLLCIYNTFKFLIYGPISLARLIAARRHERIQRRRNERAPGVHEALPGDEHGSAYLSRTSAAPEA